MIFNADMILAKNADYEAYKHLKEKTVVCATRIEPPLHPNGGEKILEDFGMYPEEFDEEMFSVQLDRLKVKDKTTEGIFAPWCMYKEDFLAIGGHDELFAPQSKEDSDLFNRFHLKGYKFIQPWDALVYHFTSRGSRFNKHSGGAAGKNSDEWLQTTTKNGRNFIRKWGHFIKHTPLMKPIVPPKYNIGLIVKNCNDSLLHALEPWGDILYIDEGNTPSMIDNYIILESPNTDYDLYSRLRPYDNEKNCEILVEIDGKTFNEEDWKILMQLSEIIKDSGSIGKFQLNNIIVEIIQMNEYQNTLIDL